MKRENNRFRVVRICIGIFIIILFVLMIFMMSMISEIQGNARVINYAGLVRGKTQRIVKLEIAGSCENEMLNDVERYINGLCNGDDSIPLIKIEDDAFQNQMSSLKEEYYVLRDEIYGVRSVGYENTDIIAVSEEFFDTCDEAVDLAESYSEKRELALRKLEISMICVLGILIGLTVYEFISAQQRIRLQNKEFYDKATGLPGKAACDELLSEKESVTNDTSVCSFDLNHVRRINKSFGLIAGDKYICAFAKMLRETFPSNSFVGRSGGDEFLVITHRLDKNGIHKCISEVKAKLRSLNAPYPDLSLSFAYGYALASDYPGSCTRELLKYADKNMYANKNRIKREEATIEKHADYELLKFVNEEEITYSDCLYCNADLNFYRKIRTIDNFFLNTSGCYSQAVEQIVFDIKDTDEQRLVKDTLCVSYLNKKLRCKEDSLDVQYGLNEQGDYIHAKVIPVDWNVQGDLLHFIIAFEVVRTNVDPKEQLALYYEQLKQDILENDSYVDALLEMADTVYTVNLSKNILEKNVTILDKNGKKNNLFMNYPLPCSYTDYCNEYSKFVTKDTLGEYRMTSSPKKLLARFASGDKHLAVEYCFQENDSIRWIKKMILMTRTMSMNEDTHVYEPIVQAIVLLQDTSNMHAREEREHAKLQIAYDEMRNANRTKSEFLSRMSHDIRTPLNGIIGLLKLDEDHFDDKQMLLENHKKMQISANHLLSLINDVLQMSKLEEGQIHLTHEVISLPELSKEIVLIIIERANSAGISWNFSQKETELPYPYLYGSPLHLRQIFLNIYGNCIKYNKPNGSITTRLKCLGEKDGYCTYQWIISDTGIGMKKSYLEHIFEPFSQEKQDARSVYQGTGLGMTIVKELIEQMHGTIQVESEYGVGSSFTITIPFEIAPAPTTNPIEMKKTDLHGVHVLLAEDNVINAEIMEALLDDQGISTIVAQDGKAALDIFCASKIGEFDAILMDVMMPVMDGIASTQAIRKLDRKDANTIPIIALTANAFDEDAKKCINAGMNAHMSKPVDMDKLIDVLSKYVKE